MKIPAFIYPNTVRRPFVDAPNGAFRVHCAATLVYLTMLLSAALGYTDTYAYLTTPLSLRSRMCETHCSGGSIGCDSAPPRPARHVVVHCIDDPVVLQERPPTRLVLSCGYVFKALDYRNTSVCFAMLLSAALDYRNTYFAVPKTTNYPFHI